MTAKALAVVLLLAAVAAVPAQESELLVEEGLPGRPWFRHLIHAPLPSYAAETLPGIREALEAGDAERAQAQAAILAAALERCARQLGASPEGGPRCGGFR